MTKPRTGQSGNWDRERADRLQEDVERMQKDVERLTAEREWSEDRFPCDGACVDAPEETCSRHGRNPADLWRIIGEVAAERNALAAAHARESEKVWQPCVSACPGGRRCTPTLSPALRGRHERHPTRPIRRASEHDEVAEGPDAHLQGLRQHHQ
jgi:hypothetical protein